MKAAIIEDLALPRKVNFSRTQKFCQIGLYLIEPPLMLRGDESSQQPSEKLAEKGLAIGFDEIALIMDDQMADLLRGVIEGGADQFQGMDDLS